MQNNSVVAMVLKIQATRRAYYAADDAHDDCEAHRLGLQLTSLEILEREIAPTSNIDAAQKLRNMAADLRGEPDALTDRSARSAIRLAPAIERDDVTPLTLRALRALIPATLQHDSETWNDGATVKALAHAIDWCARLRLV